MKNKILLAIALIAITVVTSQCKKDDENPGTNEVWIQDMAFNPSSITVAVHTTITWTNKDGSTHTVTSNNGLFNSGNLSDGSTFTHTFDSVGTYNYHCTIHSSMTGAVVVQ